ncbi:hypothetical protein KKG72_02830 [bacterium]|nr:hypothetical protein [bacterium]MBU1994232.1 hypothetical protein [bacterium]
MQQNFTTLLFSAGCMLVTLLGCNSGGESQEKITENTTNKDALKKAPFVGTLSSRTLFENPYANIPAQCYIETSYGTQNACLFCHTNAPARIKLGNTIPQAGASSFIGNLQLNYSFGSVNQFTRSANINPWENTLFPQKLQEAFVKTGADDAKWDMQSYIRTDNWSEAYAKRMGSSKEWDSGYSNPYRLFPGLNPSNLPADDDGYVRTPNTEESFFEDDKGYNTGWRAVNFMPYGIFTPHTGSVSGIYIRLKEIFMQDETGKANKQTYSQNLQLLEHAIQDRLEENDPKYYYGKASSIKVERGLYPLGTEFAHPLHYVDVGADGSDKNISSFGGTRSKRVKEIRYMYKYKMYYPGEATIKEEDGPLYFNEKEGWMDNGAGWHMSGYIEDTQGSLRAQTPEELLQCIGCHSSTYGLDPEQFTSGTGNAIDATWAFPRKFSGDLGWGEMNYLGYKSDKNLSEDQTAGRAYLGDPMNKNADKGEYRYFLEHVVGASLYGVMPTSMETYIKSIVKIENGYSSDWPQLDTSSAQQLKFNQKLRLKLMREFTFKKDYLDEGGYIRGALVFPTLKESLNGAKGYRKVVATQRYSKGKDVFSETIFTYKYYRQSSESYTHIDGKTLYKQGEVITERPYEHSETLTKGVGTVATLIDENLSFDNGGTYDSEYLPLFIPDTYETK